MKVITDLVINSFSENEIINICKKVCLDFNCKFMKFIIDKKKLLILILAEGSFNDRCKVESILDGILVGYLNSITYEVLNVKLELSESNCPSITVTDSDSDYCKWRRFLNGVEIIE